MTSDPMTARERTELAQLVRRREAVAKTDAKQRAAELIAQTEATLAATFAAEDARWAAMIAKAREAVSAANETIREACRAQGIPEKFAPSLNAFWLDRGENRYADRRGELRRVAQARIAAMELAARREIERKSVEAQTAILAGGLADGAARAMLDSLPDVADLMPEPAIFEIEAEVETQAGEKLESWAALMGGLD
jgi:hypothetical protein